jgi:hypothetical protein
MITDLLVRFTDWLAATSISRIVAEEFWIVPALQTVHILSVAVVLAGVVLINLRIVGIIDRHEAVPALLDRFLRPIAVAVAVLAVTGFLLIAGEPTRALFRVVFWTKMALIVVAFGLTWSHRAAYRPLGDGSVVVAGAVRKLVALVALLLWLAVIVAGRWIAYVEAWPGAPA